MKDFLRGTAGCVIQVVLFVLGLAFLAGSCVATSETGTVLSIVLGILCFCAVGGIRYWLGNIFRIR
jgi:amino acid transporter